jgi:hypothetical protein
MKLYGEEREKLRVICGERQIQGNEKKEGSDQMTEKCQKLQI